MTFQEYFLCENHINLEFDFDSFRRSLLKELTGLAQWSKEKDDAKWNPLEGEIEETIEDLVKESEQNIRKGIYLDIVEALQRMPYHGSKIVIQCNAVYDSFLKSFNVEPLLGDSVYLNIGLGDNGLLVIKHESGKIEVDDIIEGGEEEPEFFANENEKADYYNLVQALQNKNAFQQRQILTLYTARPKKDRAYYLSQKVLPANIFLTNNLNHAQGLALDLADKDEVRDVYKVKIEDKNLIKTLDGNISYYQLIQATKPISMQLM